MLAANSSFAGSDASIADLQSLTRKGVIRRYMVFERGGLRFGIFGSLGKKAMIYTSVGATSFAEPTVTAKEVGSILRETEKVDVVIALSHDCVDKGPDGRCVTGENLQLAKDVPGCAPVSHGKNGRGDSVRCVRRGATGLRRRRSNPREA
jgi:5'-nucleotidase